MAANGKIVQWQLLAKADFEALTFPRDFPTLARMPDMDSNPQLNCRSEMVTINEFSRHTYKNKTKHLASLIQRGI